ncbi:hypothetical protein [Sphingomonas sanxanigenens]|uniref:Uncharacterized protein n=1 Tax=Sphingomonas sanxanigenens DSM 19645 = NX02 TaxID=1123269 RepID=W0AN66_9SPHN|nr:hypothetical protein [Sphingomonas sanxanigenens]AHE57140.1 hypothetical protein NX02_27785 [Sphingomonas sanxanigenens DSM 19645 = NX02]
MHRSHQIALAGFLLAVAQPAWAEIVNLTNSAEGENKDKGVAAVKQKLVAACTERSGKPDAASFEIVFEKTSPNPDVPKPYYVDGKMKCDLP